jgi:hypothetical protein
MAVVILFTWTDRIYDATQMNSWHSFIWNEEDPLIHLVPLIKMLHNIVINTYAVKFHRDLKAIKGLKATKVLKDPLDHRVLQGNKDYKDLLVQTAKWVFRGLLDLRDRVEAVKWVLWGHEDPQERMVKRDHKDLLVLLDLKVRLDLQDLLDLLDLQEKMGHQEKTGL